MVSKAKLYTQLDLMREELHERLLPHLEQAVAGKNPFVFCATGYHPPGQLRDEVNKETDELTQLGRQILALSKKLDESTADSIAERLCWYCQKWSDTGDLSGKTAVTLAEDFLKEITKAKS